MEANNRQEPSILWLRQVVSEIYAQQGESEACVQGIQKQLGTSADVFRHCLWKDSLKHQRTSLKPSENHTSVRCIHHSRFKLALHRTKQQHLIPAHAHPGMLNIVYVLQGELLIDQTSLFEQNRHYVSHLHAHQCCVGLPNYKNVHAIQTLSESALFISIRIRRRTRQHVLKRKLAPWFFCTLLLAACSKDVGSSTNAAKQIPGSQGSLVSLFSPVAPFHSGDSIIQANEMRLKIEEGEDKYAYQAAQLYLQAAQNGNAEAQYQLGIMYLDGVGITEDEDEALYWIAAAADQDYPAARKLLRVLLEGDGVVDC